jgi:hypothetical protein
MGLKNRFSEETRSNWHYWYQCMVCGQNGWDSLHHIFSSTANGWVKGKHNESVLNSCPIHNFKCHIGQASTLHRDIKGLLWRTLRALEELGYNLKPIDCQFMEIYKQYYGEKELKIWKTGK